MVMRLSVLVLLFISSLAQGQNLVPNPGFEDYLNIPCGLNQFAINQSLSSWFEPIPTSTDYWSNLAATDCYCNPMRVQSETHSGNGMLGMITANVRFGRKVEYKEYAEVKLEQPLQKGAFYHGSFYARNRGILDRDIQRMFANNLGMAFSDTLVSVFGTIDSPSFLLAKPDIFEDDAIVAGWREVEGCFIAGSDAEYMLLGNFSSIESTSLTLANPNERFAQAYYFIDDVSLEKLPYDVSSLGKEVTICYDDESIQLNAAVAGAISYRWQDGTAQSTNTYSLKTSNQTYVDIIFEECTYRHNFQIDYIPPVKLGADTVVCTGEVLILYPEMAVKNLVWWDGSVDDTRFISESGTYSASVNIGDCSSEDSIEIDFVDCPGFVPNIITPNDDDLNDFLVFENVELLEWSLQIFNRWGQSIYFADRYLNDWNGKDVSAGTYYFRLFSRSLGKEVKGAVSVVR